MMEATMGGNEAPTHHYSVCGWSMGTLPEQGGVLEIRYLPTPTVPNDQALSIPLVLTPIQARQLSEHLARLANASEGRTDLMPQTMQ